VERVRERGKKGSSCGYYFADCRGDGPTGGCGGRTKDDDEISVVEYYSEPLVVVPPYFQERSDPLTGSTRTQWGASLGGAAGAPPTFAAGATSTVGSGLPLNPFAPLNLSRGNLHGPPGPGAGAGAPSVGAPRAGAAYAGSVTNDAAAPAAAGASSSTPGSKALGIGFPQLPQMRSLARSLRSEKALLAVNYSVDGPSPRLEELKPGAAVVTPRRSNGGRGASTSGGVEPNPRNPAVLTTPRTPPTPSFPMSPEPNPQLNDPINMVRDPKLLTPRQREVLDNVSLPLLDHYPECPPVNILGENDHGAYSSSSSGGEDDGSAAVGRRPSGPSGSAGKVNAVQKNRERLGEMFRGFIFDFYCGTYLTQLTSLQEKQLIHAQLIDEHRILALSQGSGRIVEFPILSLSKIYRISNPSTPTGTGAAAAANIIILEFQERKLAFLFHDALSSQRFLICFELLVRKIQQQAMGVR